MKKKLLYIGNKLAAKGYSPSSIDTLGALFEQEGCILFYASARRNKIFRLADMIYKVLKHRKTVDYVLIDTYSTHNFWYAVLVAQMCKMLHLKYLPLLRGGNLPQRLKKWPKTSENLFKNAFFNIAPSSYLQNIFKESGFIKVQLIPNTITLENYTFKERQSLRPKILWVRAFAEIYNPLLALQVLKELLKSYPEASLCMVGADKDGSLEHCRKFAEKHQLPVNFTGKLTKAEWISRSVNFDIFINTTHYDNTPVSVIEAMALGLPVISTRVGGIPDLLTDKEDALLIDDNDCEGFVKSIISLIQSPGRTLLMTKNARKKAEGFDWENVKLLWQNTLR
ncbi:glycosyltransferase family 4 protein [Flavimarina sp. Hel_I_48]|uniref:glycosyltransferase family 4 protein n=1 Tax=Flavimarina sp. Hel_I_48 TaxID=1392488 RepID=UPI0004DF9C17|nr:glycosyltransferase family 4 protein [Flavimarina sp. Hel_I_48]